MARHKWVYLHYLEHEEKQIKKLKPPCYQLPGKRKQQTACAAVEIQASTLLSGCQWQQSLCWSIPSNWGAEFSGSISASTEMLLTSLCFSHRGKKQSLPPIHLQLPGPSSFCWFIYIHCRNYKLESSH